MVAAVETGPTGTIDFHPEEVDFRMISGDLWDALGGSPLLVQDGLRLPIRSMMAAVRKPEKVSSDGKPELPSAQAWPLTLELSNKKRIHGVDEAAGETIVHWS